MGFSRIVNLGNQADITSAEMLGAGVLDEYTRVVTGYMEGVADGGAFVEAAGRVARELPVVFLKAGRGASGARAVASHTGALAGDQVYVDMDLSMSNLPPGTRLSIGEAVIEVSAAPHTGCAKFAGRFGAEALRFANVGPGRDNRFRGMNALIIEGGSFAVGDKITKL